MKSSLISKNIRRLGLILVLLAAATLPSPASFAAEQKKPPSAAAASKTEPMLSPEEFRKQEDWRASIALVPRPKKGCFTAKFPSLEWQEIPCVNGPEYPMPPRSGIVPETIGNGDDVAAQAPSGIISSAIGSFDTLTNVTSESGPIANAGASHPTPTHCRSTRTFSKRRCAMHRQIPVAEAGSSLYSRTTPTITAPSSNTG